MVLAHGAFEIALVDPLANGCQTPVGKSSIEIELRQVPTTPFRVTLSQLCPAEEATTTGG